MWKEPPNGNRSAVPSDELDQVVGEGPAEGDERVAPLLVDRLEQAVEIRVQLLGLEALVVEGQRVAVALALHDEVALVVLAVLDAEALGQAAAPGPLLTRGHVVGP